MAEAKVPGGGATRGSGCGSGKCDNQPNKTGAMQGRGVTRGGGTARGGGECTRGQQQEAPTDKRQRRRRKGAGGTTRVSWQHSGWQRRQQEGRGGIGKEEEEEDVDLMRFGLCCGKNKSEAFSQKVHTGDGCLSGWPFCSRQNLHCGFLLEQNSVVYFL